MDIRTMRYFVTVADTKGITSAARLLNMTQPPLSSQLKALEEEIGFPLFNRVGKTFLLTAEGMVLYQHAKKILADYDSLDQLFTNMRTGVTGTLKLGSTRMPTLLLLPKVTANVLQDNPGVKFNLTEGKSWDLKKLLDDRKLDLAFVQTHFDEREYYSINIEPLLSKDGIPSIHAVGLPQFFQTEADTVELKEIADMPLIVHIFQKDAILEACYKQKIHPNIICTNTDLFSSLMWSQMGMGVALMLNNTSGLIDVIKFENRLVTKRVLGIDYTPKPNQLIWRKDVPTSSVMRLFIGEISNMLSVHGGANSAE